jgi:hypothetical protein
VAPGLTPGDTGTPPLGDNGAMTSEPSNQSPEDIAAENKRKMREALHAKQNRHGEDHIESDPKQPQAHGPVDQKRTFRRKTG